MKLTNKSEPSLGMAAKVQKLRLEKNFSLQQVAELSGISITTLTQIERGVIEPPIAVLMKLAKAFGVHVNFFFSVVPSPGKPYVVTERHRNQTIYRSGEKYGYSYQRLAAEKANKMMEPFLVRFTNAKGGAESSYQHEGEEFIYLITGEIEYTVDDQIIMLHAGDSLYIDAEMPHKIRCLSEQPAEALVVIYNPGNDLRV